MSVLEIGCCGAYCRTCKVFTGRNCKGCKIGYANGTRDLSKARCSMKVCCMKDLGLATCADCDRYDTCPTLQGFFGKKGYKYRKYRETLDFIRAHGYERFLSLADLWKGAYGKLAG